MDDKKIEFIPWFDWQELEPTDVVAHRLYVGNECCEKRLPRKEDVQPIIQELVEYGKPPTLVTPFLSQRGLDAALSLIDELTKWFNPLEVVCNDWGLLHEVFTNPRCLPIIGRLLVKQTVDLRVAYQFDAAFQKKWERDVTHVDGTVAQLRHKPPPETMRTHIRSCALDSPELFSFLEQSNVHRFEFNNVLQGLDLNLPPGWKASLHIPDVLVSISRDCSFPRGDRGFRQSCAGGECLASISTWHHESFPLPLYHIDNGVYYLNHRIPGNSESLGIDRIIFRHWLESPRDWLR